MKLAKIKALKEKQGAIRDEMTAIVDKATDGVLSAEETTAFDAKEAEFKAIGETVKRMEAMPDVEDVAPGRDLNPGGGQEVRSLVDRVVIPATARHQGRLKAFSGVNAEKEAYIAGQFIAATIFGVQASQQWCRDHGVNIRSAMSEGTTTAGGYLTPVEMENTIIALREQHGVARREARQMPMGSDVKDVPVRTSGLTTYWPGEGVAITASDMVFGNAQLVAKKLCALAVYSSELGEDSIISLGDLITQEVAFAFAVEEDDQFFNGSGSPWTGIIDSLAAGSKMDAAAGHTGFETLTMSDLEQLIGMVPHYAGANNKFYVSKAGYCASMLRLLDAAGGNTNVSLSNGVTPQFLGYDIIYTQVMDATLGVDVSTPKIIFGDLSLGTLLGNRRGITIAQSSEFKFAEDQLAVKATSRTACNIHGVGTASLAGPIVMLSTPAA